jgi:hypothetical protein
MAPAQKMFQKRWLIPLWVVQLIVLGIYFVLACVGMSASDDIDDYLDNSGFNSSDSDAVA